MSDHCTAERAARPVAPEATPDFSRKTAPSASRAVSAERSAAGRLGLQRFGQFVTQAELTAHFRILDVIAARSAAPGGRRGRTGRKLHDRQKESELVSAFARQLDVFAPRCLCGRGPLRVKAEIGRKLLSCVCGFRCVEAR